MCRTPQTCSRPRNQGTMRTASSFSRKAGFFFLGGDTMDNIPGRVCGGRLCDNYIDRRSRAAGGAGCSAAIDAERYLAAGKSMIRPAIEKISACHRHRAQNNMQYRVNYLTRTPLFKLHPLFAMVSLCEDDLPGNSKARGGSSNGLTRRQIIFILHVVAVVDVFHRRQRDELADSHADIREGPKKHQPVYPQTVDYLWYRLCLFISGGIAFISWMHTGGFIFCSGAYFVAPAAGTGGCFQYAGADGPLLQVFHSRSHGHAGVWLLEISTFDL